MDQGGTRVDRGRLIPSRSATIATLCATKPPARDYLAPTESEFTDEGKRDYPEAKAGAVADTRWRRNLRCLAHGWCIAGSGWLARGR